jgi:ubiquinone/menaquinone biosynthesis C-methylase UbiE
MHLHPEFQPSLFHPYYFIRNGLKDNIQKNASHMSGKLLDFGCGSKPYKSLFNVSEYIGVDFENEGHPHDNEQIDIFYDGKSLPFPEKYFDSILCSEVFEHVFNLDEVLGELNRVLKKDGKILVTCPFVWNEHEVPYDYARYTRFALNDILSKRGFEVIEYSKAGNFVTTIAQLIELYFFNTYKGIWQKFFLFRWFYKISFFLLPNVIGLLLNKFLPKNQTLYLNNILVAKKILDA